MTGGPGQAASAWFPFSAPGLEFSGRFSWCTIAFRLLRGERWRGLGFKAWTWEGLMSPGLLAGKVEVTVLCWGASD